MRVIIWGQKFVIHETGFTPQKSIKYISKSFNYVSRNIKYIISKNIKYVRRISNILSAKILNT